MLLILYAILVFGRDCMVIRIELVLDYLALIKLEEMDMSLTLDVLRV